MGGLVGGGARTGDARDRLLAGEVRDVHERVVEGREDARDAEHELALGDLGAQLHRGLFLRRFRFLGGLVGVICALAGDPSVWNGFKQKGRQWIGWEGSLCRAGGRRAHHFV